MTNDITIRKATITDVAALRVFEQGVIAAERPFDPTLKQGLIYYYDLEGMMASPEAEIVVAEYGGEIVASGYARIEEAKQYYQHRKYAYLGFMFVHPDYRGKGINAQVIAALRETAASWGITEMRLEVYYNNEPAIRAYEKIGFIKHMIEMRMPV